MPKESKYVCAYGQVIGTWELSIEVGNLVRL